MSNSLRSVITVLAALTASSVAPAQVSEDTEPLVATDMAVAPVQAIVQTLDDEVVLSTGETPDPLAPSDEIATTDEDSAPAKPAGDLTSLVAQLRGSDAGSRELECL